MEWEYSCTNVSECWSRFWCWCTYQSIWRSYIISNDEIFSPIFITFKVTPKNYGKSSIRTGSLINFQLNKRWNGFTKSELKYLLVLLMMVLLISLMMVEGKPQQTKQRFNSIEFRMFFPIFIFNHIKHHRIKKAHTSHRDLTFVSPQPNAHFLKMFPKHKIFWWISIKYV